MQPVSCMMKKKGKSRKANLNIGPTITTTCVIRRRRDNMSCPRIGDAFSRTDCVDEILQDVAESILLKASVNKSNFMNLAGMRMNHLLDLLNFGPNLKTLVDINLAKNNLFNSDNVFEALLNLPALVRVDLSHNFLNGPLSLLAGRMTRLEELHLDVNNISSLPSTIVGWKVLLVLTLSDNLLTALPEEAAELSELRNLSIKNNKIALLSGTLLQAWTKLEKFHGSSNLIKKIPDEIGYCVCLQMLDLSCNAIDEIPAGLAQCFNLEILHLGDNKISSISPGIFSNIRKLRELQLFKNKISIVPTDIGLLTGVQRISFASNNIRSLPEEIGACQSLEELYLSNNAKLSSLPSSAGHLRRLQELSCRRCPALKQLTGAPGEWIALKELDLRAAKKQVCKMTPEISQTLKLQQCVVRGGIVKKAKKPSKKAKEKPVNLPG